MHKIWLVIKQEVVSTLRQRSFWITSFLFPLIIFAMTFGSQIVAEGMMDDGEEQNADTAVATDEREIAGYVDLAGVIEEVPENFPEGFLRAYPGETEARAALEAGEIESYYLVPKEFYQTGETVLIQEQFSPMQEFNDVPPFEYLLTYNLTGDRDAAALIMSPVPKTETVSLAPEPRDQEGEAAGADGFAATILPMAMIFIFFFVLTMSSNYMLRSVTKEKETNVMEVLLLSLRPLELMVGKIIGLGALALLQMAIWLAGVFFVLGEGLPMVGLLAGASPQLPPRMLVWFALYFLFGYFTFASALGAIGSMAPNAREGSQFTFAVLLPLMIPLWLNQSLINEPNGTLATVLSILPLTSPVSMVSRLAATTVPLWQILLSLALSAATAYGFVLLSTKFFRADNLLSGAGLSWERILGELKGREAA
jgi:ABC-2 type transport system permease protein